MSWVNFLYNKFRAGDPLRKVANAAQQNRIANILNDIEGVNCEIQKPVNLDGLGWKIVVPPYYDTDFINEIIEGTGADKDRRKSFAVTLAADRLSVAVREGWVYYGNANNALYFPGVVALGGGYQLLKIVIPLDGTEGTIVLLTQGAGENFISIDNDDITLHIVLAHVVLDLDSEIEGALKIEHVYHDGDLHFPSLLDGFDSENIGSGAAVYKGFDADDRKHQFRSLVQGRGIVITGNDDDITIEAKRIPISSIESSAQDPDDPEYDPDEPPFQPAGYVPIADGNGGVYWHTLDNSFKITLAADRLGYTVSAGFIGMETAGFQKYIITDQETFTSPGYVVLKCNPAAVISDTLIRNIYHEIVIESALPSAYYEYDISSDAMRYNKVLAYITEENAILKVEKVYHEGALYFDALHTVLVNAKDGGGPKFLADCFPDIDPFVNDPFPPFAMVKVAVYTEPSTGENGPKTLRLYLTHTNHAIVDQRVNVGSGVGVFHRYNDDDVFEFNHVYEYRSLYQMEGVRIILDAESGNIEIEARHYNADTTGVPVLEWDEINFAYAHYRIDGYGPLQVTAGDAEAPIDIRLVSTGQPEGATLIADGAGGTDWGSVAALHVNGSDGGWTDSKAQILYYISASNTYLHRTLLAEEGIRLQQLDTNIRIRASHQNGIGLGETFGAWDSTEVAYLHRRIRGENGVKTSTEEGSSAPIVIEANIDTTEDGTVKVLSRVVVDSENKKILGYKATLSLAIGENGKLKLTLVEDIEPELIHQGGDCDEEPVP